MSNSLPLKVAMSDFRNNLSAYLDAVEAGKTVTVMRRGKPSAVLSKAQVLPEKIDVDALKAFREGLGIHLESSIIARLRQDERY